ncbi:MAG TPA: GIDE domain-containing protein [Nitrospiraceae bacterium]|nr:GIDE domain-containing protein [Nitrospiraceae bacterium]
MFPMKCLDCQEDLIEIPTSQGPGLDICSSGHGLWLDAGEVNFFVEDYTSLKRAIGDTGSVAVKTETLCPRCGNHMESETVAHTSFLSCDSCRGWWLPHGSLTRLNETYRGAAVPIEIKEAELYTRAASRHCALNETSRDQPKSNKKRANLPGSWFWVLFFGFALALGGIILVSGIGKAMRTMQWNRPPDQILIYLVAGTVGGFGLFIYGWMIRQRKRLIESIPTSTIRSLALGLVEISGQAQPEGSLLSSPFNGLPCVFYSYSVEEHVGSGKQARWETIAKGTSEQPFFVRDTTGRVLIVPLGAELILPDERTSRSNWMGELPPSTTTGLNRLGISTERWMGSRTLRCRESFILPDEQVYVLGTAHEHLEGRGSGENVDRLYIGSSQDNEFIISDRSEKALLSQLRWQMLACGVGGLTLAASCLVIIFKYYLTAV